MNLKIQASSNEIEIAHANENAAVNTAKTTRRTLTAERKAHSQEIVALEEDLARAKRSIDSMRGEV